MRQAILPAACFLIVSSTSAPPVSSDAPAPDANRMTGEERRASGALALVFALRMLGLFIVLPVFALEAARLPGGDDPARVGFAMGLYGLTQAFLQIPFGIASDRFGRKPTIVAGLLVFAAGSAIAAWAPDLTWLSIGRAVQGAGAISAAVTAFLADVTRDSVRTKAMAMVGASIALMFALSLVIAPLLAGWVGLPGIFGMTCTLALLGIAVVLWVGPPEPRVHRPPAMQHVRGGVLFPMERKGRLRAAFLIAIALIGVVQIGLWWLAGSGEAPGLWALGGLMFVFFIGFNTLEASQPSLVSKLAPAHARGAALGVYNTLQSVGFFVGGAVGGWLARAHGASGLFAVCALGTLVWLVAAWPMQAPAVKR